MKPLIQHWNGITVALGRVVGGAAGFVGSTSASEVAGTAAIKEVQCVPVSVQQRGMILQWGLQAPKLKKGNK